MKRDAEFYNDDKIGKIGEEFFKKILKSKSKENWDIINVSDDEYFRKLDIDLIESLHDEIDSVKDGRFESWDEKRFSNIGRSWEIKTDTYIERTGNATYEFFVRNKSMGCTELTTADFIVYLQYSEDERRITNGWYINPRKWRDWLRQHLRKKDYSNYIKVTENSNNEGYRILFNCKINILVKDKIATRIPF